MVRFNVGNNQSIFDRIHFWKYAFVLLIFLLLSAIELRAQGQPDKVYTSTKNQRAFEAFTTSTAYFMSKDFKKTESLLKNAIKWDSNYVDAYLRMGAIYHMRGDFALEEELYAKIIKIQPLLPDAFFNIAFLQMNRKAYQEAISNFNQFLTFKNLSEKFTQKAYYDLEVCKFRDHAYKNPVPFNPENLGDGINTALEEYWPVLTADDQTLYFTRRVKLDSNKQYHIFNFNEDVYLSTYENGNWTKAVSIPGFLNSPNLNEGALSITPDGKQMYLTICSERDDVGYGSCDIYVSDNKDGKWTAPKNLGDVINSRYKETQPSITFDGKTLYFSSDRDGTFGRLDIWKSTKNENGKWTEPVNLGRAINTVGNEQSPFIHPDNKTLYFSSVNRIGMGGSDLYVAKKGIDGNFYEIKNLGYPINTENEEIALFVDASGKKAYFSSSTNAKGFGLLDIYSFDLPVELRPNPVCYLKGIVYDSITKAKLGARFELINVESGETILTDYSDDKTGKYLAAIPSDANYMLNVSKKGYLFYSAHLPIKGIKSSAFIKDIPLQPIQVGQIIVLNNIFFRFDSFSLKHESVAELKKVINFLNEYPNVKVELSGHTDSKGSDTYNLTLSENRARIVFEYLINVGKINKDRMTYKGYGETKPIDTNETEEGRANNRRTEFKIIGI